MKSLIRLTKVWWFWGLCVGLVLRLIVMPITLHPDLWGHSFTAYFLAYEGEWNVYEYLLSLPSSHPLVRNFGVGDIFIYPPLAYFTLGFFRLLVKPFVDANFIPWLMENLSQVHLYPQLYQQLFFFKLPYLFVDIAIAFLLSSYFVDKKKKSLAFLLWMVNPVTLYATFMVGQLDVLPVFFVVLSLFFAQKKKPLLAMICLGIGGSYKMFPLLFILPAAFVLKENFVARLKLVAAGFLPFFLSILPFLGSSAFRSMVLFSPKNQKMLFMSLPVSGAEGVYLFVFLLAIIYLFAYYFRERFSLVVYWLLILLLTFSVTHYHPQWFLWVTPLLVIELVGSNFRNFLLTGLLIISWLVILLFFEPSLSFGLFNPLWPELDKAPGLSETLGNYTNVFQFKSVIRSIFAAVALFFAFRLTSPQENHA